MALGMFRLFLFHCGIPSLCMYRQDRPQAFCIILMSSRYNFVFFVWSTNNFWLFKTIFFSLFSTPIYLFTWKTLNSWLNCDFYVRYRYPFLGIAIDQVVVWCSHLFMKLHHFYDYLVHCSNELLVRKSIAMVAMAQSCTRFSKQLQLLQLSKKMTAFVEVNLANDRNNRIQLSK